MLLTDRQAGTLRGAIVDSNSRLTFVDVFAGCGGLSLGLLNSGWHGKFAVERSHDAFSTLSENLISVSRKSRRFDWPEWLPKEAIDISTFLDSYGGDISSLKGKLTLLAGGPPCQGFSLAGRRNQSDPRNRLTEEYIRLVNITKPRILLIENVRGFTLPFKKNGGDEKESAYSERVAQKLDDCGYKVFTSLIDLSRYGVPQTRKRFILIAILKGDPALSKLGCSTPFDLLEKERKKFLSSKCLPTDRQVTVREAIGDLEISGSSLIPYESATGNSTFKRIASTGAFASAYIRLMRKGISYTPDSLRLPRHSDNTRFNFQLIMKTCAPGRTISLDDRSRLGIKKHAITPLHPNRPSATITTLPDDIIHYSEARILTARENARLQSFPDYFKFTGKYTTGGKNRKNECPRYTQIGNAVPPLFAEALGRTLKKIAKLP
ncbi:DNA (cytosine-5-)-methyltransferase [Stenotrophomonas sp. ZAC14D2_NAIMI4_7]|uniref:DNA cytosine methyltransferase n=1 Tax=Stenotrophomonas sp. ZAC14D2_NAIMI4_7 TaxID=2072405 RepID=UPI000D540B6C|nr:DNA cytosine methyltransferase [Stenotrophomonas sp. ZAC14D2_NAIMI4_7]AWH16219.1 DNA (cytosine-5-)-methyltransferase [Stenotrophomonas sp. ZAC14D2_NAIMI4_7]